ncbi:hypothetical protein ACJ72_01255 [Emergomyces africanus]|uniref:Phosphate transporter n=1 Tax=Emergomyces africanus TaxID=1955775 RepID=A0A1B7P5S9_9EURO|nr:hypothetical protein ACJ72_01255 [Emergomyces africanus]
MHRQPVSLPAPSHTSRQWSLAPYSKFLEPSPSAHAPQTPLKTALYPSSAFRENAGVQLLAFICALAAASSWVMWCTPHSAHVFFHLLIFAVAGVGVATIGAPAVQWDWNNGKGLGAIFAGLAMAPAFSAGFATRSPNLGLNKKPAWYIAAVTLGTGVGPSTLAATFFVSFVLGKVIKRYHGIKWWMFILGPSLFKRPGLAIADMANVPNYAAVQKDPVTELSPSPCLSGYGPTTDQGIAVSIDGKTLAVGETTLRTNKNLVTLGENNLHANLRKKGGSIGRGMRTLQENPLSAGQIHEVHNMKIMAKCIPAMIVCRMLFCMHYDIHAAQTGISSTADVLTACTASFAHGANDIGNSVGPWAVIYSAWSTGNAAASKAPLPVYQLAVLSLTISLGLITYGYIIMRVMGNKITYHSPRGTTITSVDIVAFIPSCSMEMGAALTVLVFSQFSLPMPTSMCITGATVSVELCNGTLEAVTWQRVGLLLLSWIATTPVAGTLGGVLMGFILNAPHFL